MADRPKKKIEMAGKRHRRKHTQRGISPTAVDFLPDGTIRWHLAPIDANSESSLDQECGAMRPSMVAIDLKGLHWVKAKGKTYCYAWRGGPSVKGKPGSAEFIASYNQAVIDRQAPDSNKLRSVIEDYKKTELPKLAPSTQKNWARWIDLISTDFGDLSIAQFDRTNKIRPYILRWRGKFSDTPRAADYGIQVLSRILSHAIDPLGKIGSNPCEGIRHIYKASRSDVIWRDENISQLKEQCSSEIGYAVDLAIHTGLRVSDLIRLSWSYVAEVGINITTGKSNHRREARIPIYCALKEVPGSIPKRSTTVLTNGLGRPWTRDGLGSSFNKAKTAAGMKELGLHFHDLRGTAATKFYVAGLDERLIAEIMGWEEDQVNRIMRRYVSRGAATQAAIDKLNGAKSGT